MPAIAYSVTTGAYTIEQLEGEACARCGRKFTIGEKSRPTCEVFDGAQLFAHVECPKRPTVATTVITPARARRRIDRAEVLASLAEVHDAWRWVELYAADLQGELAPFADAVKAGCSR